MSNIINSVAKMLSYPFIYHAFIVGILIALCAALLGVSLVLKRFSMIGDGLSHVGFGALAVAAAMNAAPLAVAIPVVILAAFLLLRLRESSRIKGDAAIAIISAGALAVGVTIVSISTGMTADIYNYMFGSINSLSSGDVILSVILSVTVLILYVIFYPKIFAVTFDEEFAKATGIRTGLYNLLIAFLTAIMIVLGMKLMGTLLISALIIFPPLTSMRLFKSFRSVVTGSAIISVVCFIIGISISYFYITPNNASLPTGACVVLANIAAFIIFYFINLFKKLKN